jgi:predicted transcriptional regulator
MATNLLDLTTEIVSAHVSVTEMTSDDLLKELKMVYATLQALEKGEKPTTIEASAQETKKQSKKAQEPMKSVAEKAEDKPAIPPAPAMTI